MCKMLKVLVFNAGSSSLKFSLFEMPSERLIVKGMVEAIGLERSDFIVNDKVKKVVVPDHDKAVSIVLDFLKNNEFDFDVIAHRVVHDGGSFRKPVIANDHVLDVVKRFSELAPLHNPHNLAVVRACKVLNKPQVLYFDTGFYKELPKHQRFYAIPLELQKRLGVERFGFHGISHEFVSNEVFKTIKKGRLIICHLGAGSSVSAVVDNKCVATSMGFTPLEGVVMSTRSGSIDPGLILFLVEKLGLENVKQLLNHNSGLKGLTGFSDMRDVLNSLSSESSKLGFEMFTNSVAFYVAGFAALMNGLDAITFTAGIGENEPRTREAICEKLGFLGVEIDEQANKDNKKIISTKNSRVKVFVIKTNEELLIARKAFGLVS